MYMMTTSMRSRKAKEELPRGDMNACDNESIERASTFNDEHALMKGVYGRDPAFVVMICMHLITETLSGQGTGRGTHITRLNSFFVSRGSMHRHWAISLFRVISQKPKAFPHRGDPSCPCPMKPKELVKLAACSQSDPRRDTE